MRLIDLAAASLEHNGVGIAELRCNPVAMVGVAFTHSSGDFSIALTDNINKSVLKGHMEANETFEKWTTKGELNNFHPGTRINMSTFPSLRKVAEGAEYKYATMADSGETIVLLTYGELFSITRQAIINDDLAVFSTLPQAMGRAAKRTVGDLVYAVVIDNPNMSDGNPLFHANHGNLSADVLDVAGMGNARKMMRKQTAPGGGVLNIAPKHIIVPTDLEAQAYTVVNSSSIPGAESNSGIANPVNSLGEVLVEPRLDGSPDNFYLVGGAENPCVEVAYLGGNETPYLEQQSGFSVDGVAYKVRLDVGVSAIDHRSISKHTGGLPA